MAETIQNTDNLLDLTKITEPFDLASALRYMKENGEFIRCKNVSDDFYMSRDVKKRPVIEKAGPKPRGLKPFGRSTSGVVQSQQST